MNVFEWKDDTLVLYSLENHTSDTSVHTNTIKRLNNTVRDLLTVINTYRNDNSALDNIDASDAEKLRLWSNITVELVTLAIHIKGNALQVYDDMVNGVQYSTKSIIDRLVESPSLDDGEYKSERHVYTEKNGWLLAMHFKLDFSLCGESDIDQELLKLHNDALTLMKKLLIIRHIPNHKSVSTDMFNMIYDCAYRIVQQDVPVYKDMIMNLCGFDNFDELVQFSHKLVREVKSNADHISASVTKLYDSQKIEGVMSQMLISKDLIKYFKN